MAYADNIKKQLCKVTFTGPVTDKLFEIHIHEGKTTHMKQTPYLAALHDIIRADREGRRLLIRKGHVKGFLTGKNGDRLTSFEKIRLPFLPEDFWDKPATYTVVSPDDPAYRTPRTPVKVFRKSVPFDAVITAKGLDAAIFHRVFLELPTGMKRDCHYVVSVDRTAGIHPFEMIYTPLALRSSAVHVSQVGWRPDDAPKLAFVSEWMGTGGGLDFSRHKRFVVINNRTGTSVFSGNMTIAKSADSFDDAYAKNFNKTDVWQADFNTVRKEGSYRVCVYGVGCSWPVQIGRHVWHEVHVKALRAFYHQRSGIAIGPPWTPFKRSAAFLPGKNIKIFQSITPLMATSNGFLEGDDNFNALVNGRTSKEVRDIRGGYFDAGDWDRRIQHLRVARYLLDLYLQYPDFYTGLPLNIPESSNTIPDILDEALWSVDFFSKLQTTDGGIRGGVESGGHPFYGETSWQESHNIYAYAPGVWSSYLYAATAARSSLVIEKFDTDKAAFYKKSALQAMDWAEREIAEKGKLVSPEVRDARNLAASELLRLTGTKKFRTIFLETTVFNKDEAPLRQYDKHDQAEAAWSYLNIPAERNNPVSKNCKKAVIAAADKILTAQKKAGFGWAKRPWLPAFGGVFTSPDIPEVVWAWWLTKEKKYLSSLVLAMQHTFGANPLNISYMTGVGHAFPENVMNFDARITGQPVPEGITVLGPLDFEQFGGAQNSYYKALGKRAMPDPLLWPVMETFWDVFWFPMMCEYSIEKLSSNALITGVLAAR
jgi:endoglucanase